MHDLTAVIELGFASWNDRKCFPVVWEQRKLGELTEERTDRSSQGELLSVTMHDGIKKFKELGKKDNSSKNKSNYKVIKAGDIGYNSMRMWQGASGLSQWTGIVSPAYTIVKVGPQLNPQFLAYSFKRPTMIWNFQTHSQGLTSDTWNLKFPELSKLKLRFPNLEEQQEIVSLLSKLDDTIALHQRASPVDGPQRLLPSFSKSLTLLQLIFIIWTNEIYQTEIFG